IFRRRRRSGCGRRRGRSWSPGPFPAGKREADARDPRGGGATGRAEARRASLVSPAGRATRREPKDGASEVASGHAAAAEGDTGVATPRGEGTGSFVHGGGGVPTSGDAAVCASALGGVADPSH